jgi:heterogeneous nuclear ribonucleoprotein Q
MNEQAAAFTSDYLWLFKLYFLSAILAHSDLDSRALDALKEFNAEGGVAVLKEFKDSNLEHVSNKSAYLCGVMKTYRQKNRMGAEASAGAKKPGPDETKLKVNS